MSFDQLYLSALTPWMKSEKDNKRVLKSSIDVAGTNQSRRRAWTDEGDGAAGRVEFYRGRAGVHFYCGRACPRHVEARRRGGGRGSRAAPRCGGSAAAVRGVEFRRQIQPEARLPADELWVCFVTGTLSLTSVPLDL